MRLAQIISIMGFTFVSLTYFILLFLINIALRRLNKEIMNVYDQNQSLEKGVLKGLILQRKILKKAFLTCSLVSWAILVFLFMSGVFVNSYMEPNFGFTIYLICAIPLYPAILIIAFYLIYLFQNDSKISKAISKISYCESDVFKLRECKHAPSCSKIDDFRLKISGDGEHIFFRFMIYKAYKLKDNIERDYFVRSLYWRVLGWRTFIKHRHLYRLDKLIDEFDLDPNDNPQN
ncbi:hypothetical protein [Mycoplasma sp. Ms02]|uniref:hypothetical protein n=1 Tax=Mycoplasma sp. Ms02 TaxID=353851 RepID=UPI001C89739B|nr:hypothetical protein [Mycoplasma sp. Ms02]QZE12663.1 hypothetical protein K4L35_01610 [Mycoplasma sp. Ms02]